MFFKLWFYWACIMLGLHVIKTIGLCADVGGLVKCGDSLGCCTSIYGLVVVVLGCIWRWDEAGTALANREGTTYGDPMEATGKAMNIFLIVYIVLHSLPCLCIIPICCCVICAAAGSK